ncbi:hypothetical protein C5167_048038 [Papaver somniferum]|uniref:tyrosine--tRNA ligase n=1 Tax=Papaver somniferum TaxID=3469 RepID=A0A4Y7KKE4_PAPSO|nr:hypothetical protein C5167_048038 [Papaver somniferum]
MDFREIRVSVDDRWISLKRVLAPLHFKGFGSMLHISCGEEVEYREERIMDAELMELLKNKPEPISYDGFDPSGRMHIAQERIQAIVKAIKVNKVTDFGCRVKILVGDVFEKLNNKLCGDKEKIRVAGKYFMEIWKVIRMKFFDKVEFLWCPNAINSRASEYWDLGLDTVGTFNGERIKKCCAITGREENEDLNPGQIMYPYMLPDLKEGQDKMSKSDVSSASLWKMKRYTVGDQVENKINKAHFPEGIVEGNPCLEYIKHIIFPWFQEFEVERFEEHGGNKTFKNLEDLITDYQNKKLHPADLKPALAKALNRILKALKEEMLVWS